MINQGGRQYYIVNCTQQKVLDSEVRSRQTDVLSRSNLTAITQGNNVWQPMRSEEKDFHAENVEQTQKGRVAKFAT